MTSSSGRSMASGREGDRGGRVATHRLEQHAHVGELRPDEPLVAAVGDDGDVVGEAVEARGRRLEQRARRRPAAGRASGVRVGSAGGAASRRRRP